MKTKKYRHLSIECREAIRDGLYARKSSREIAKEIGVNHSTIAREVKRNRVVKIPALRLGSRTIFCANFSSCGKCSEVCNRCASPQTLCKKCKHMRCHELCNDFKIKECKTTKTWPYICEPNCNKRSKCRLPKCSYSPSRAQESYKEKLVSSREGVNLDAEEMKELRKLVEPMLEKGKSPYFCSVELAEKMKVSPRTLYRYIDRTDIDIPALKLKRKVKYKKRKKHNDCERTNFDVSGREYSDFLELPEELKHKVTQGDTVEGFRANSNRIFTLHRVSVRFQFMQLIHDGTSKSIVKTLDYFEQILGSTDAFNRYFPVLLLDRGDEFSDIEGMERSYFEPDKQRCKVYFCDPRRPDQKGAAEKNHEHIREILPKGRSNFDALNAYDVATLCSNINSYVRASLSGKTPYECALESYPKKFLDELGIIKIKKEEVQLNPLLLPHTQKRN